MSLEDLYIIVALITSVGLIISECLAWSSCEANGITQIYKIFHCCIQYKITASCQTDQLDRYSEEIQTDLYMDDSSSSSSSSIQSS